MPIVICMETFQHLFSRFIISRFTDTQNINNLLQKIGKLPHIRGGTRTDRALELAAEDFFGWQETGDRPDVPNVLLVLTDGNTNEGSKPFSQVLTPLEVFKISYYFFCKLPFFSMVAVLLKKMPKKFHGLSLDSVKSKRNWT